MLGMILSSVRYLLPGVRFFILGVLALLAASKANGRANAGECVFNRAGVVGASLAALCEKSCFVGW